MWSFRQQRLHVSSSTAQCTPYSLSKSLDLISTANLRNGIKNSATGCGPVVQPCVQKNNDTSRSLGFGEVRHFFVSVWKGQKHLESLPRPTFFFGLLSGLPSAYRSNDTSLIFLRPLCVSLSVLTLRDKSFPYTKVKCVLHFMCWPWSKLNNLVKSLKEFKTLNTVHLCFFSLGKP